MGEGEAQCLDLKSFRPWVHFWNSRVQLEKMSRNVLVGIGMAFSILSKMRRGVCRVGAVAHESVCGIGELSVLWVTL